MIRPGSGLAHHRFKVLDANVQLFALKILEIAGVWNRSE